MYLELITLSTDTAGQARLLNQLFHLFQKRGLGHHLTLLISLKSKKMNPTLKQVTLTEIQINCIIKSKQKMWETEEKIQRKTHRHAQSSQGLLSHGHSHALLLSSGLPAGCFNLQVNVAVLPQRLQKVLCQRPDAFVTGYLLQLVQVGYRIGAY